MKKRGLVWEFWRYMKVRKKWWLMPIIIIIMLMGMILIFGQSSVLAPFIYTIF